MPDQDQVVEDEEVLPGEETPPEETHDGFIALDKHQKDVNVQHKKFRDEERGRVAAEERASGLQGELDELKGSQTVVEIPAVPDRYSDTYDADMATRDTAIMAKAEQDAELTRQAQARKEKDEALIAEADQTLLKRVDVFGENTAELGLNLDATKKAVDFIAAYGINDNFRDILLEDSDGPLFTQYLAENPIEIEKMNSMSVLQLVNHINSDVRAKASLLKPQTSNAPDPPITPSGGGAPEPKEDWEEGAKYDYGTG